MSGFAGILNLDGAPVDGDLLRKLTDSLRFRGPDGKRTWTDGAVGLGHTLLRTTDESAEEQQPLTLDGSVWIVADARIDGREDLVGKIAAVEQRDQLEGRPDVELVLRAYLRWGEDCLTRLEGDFSFAIWDKRRRRLFCARDHFGVKPFYYALARNTLVLSNTLNCIRHHPAVSSRLNELAIADFLMLDWNHDLASTSFAQIQRVPPGHCLSISENEVSAPKRYWAFTCQEVRYRRAQDYVERCQELLVEAVNNRVRTNRVGVWMSGGLDSTLVAGFAKQVLSAKARDSDLRAYTVVYDRIIPDVERPYAQAAADCIGLTIRFLAADDYEPYQGPQFRWPEPVHDPLQGIAFSQYREMLGHCRVVLSGYGGDPLLLSSSLYAFEMLRSFQCWGLLTGIIEFFRRRRGLPRLGIRTALRRLRGIGDAHSAPPQWINPSLFKRLELSNRWRELTKEWGRGTQGRAVACQAATDSFWQFRFESLDPGVTSFPIEVRHPFFSLKLSQFLVGIPALPWALDKCILRACGENVLTRDLRLRPKTPLQGSPLFEHAKRGVFRGGIVGEIHRAGIAHDLADYVDLARIAPGVPEDAFQLWVDLRPVSLNHWLRTRNEQETISSVYGGIT